jgi:excinuclease ABC subunit C
VTAEEYQERLNKAVDILNGNISEAEALLTEQMKAAAAAQKFEKASSYRDMISNLREVCGIKRRTFENASIPSVVGHTAVEDLQKTLKLKTLPMVIECFDISNIGGTLAVASLVRFRDGKPEKSGYRRFRIRTVEGANDFAMMSEAVGRHFKRLLEENQPLPDLLVVDGGIGQLNAALRTLTELKCPPLPVIGLAERNEEIYIPGRREPLALDHHHAGLRVLQAVRDEAHRFAISYHRDLRQKRLTESLLDDLPGIGEKRKMALLKAFGSVRELRKAAVRDITSRVPGIGENLAAEIISALSRKSTPAPDNNPKTDNSAQ